MGRWKVCTNKLEQEEELPVYTGWGHLVENFHEQPWKTLKAIGMRGRDFTFPLSSLLSAAIRFDSPFGSDRESISFAIVMQAIDNVIENWAEGPWEGRKICRTRQGTNFKIFFDFPRRVVMQKRRID